MEWAEVASQFAEDSSLRDIYILDTTVDDWQTVLDALRELDPSPVFSLNHEPSELPERAGDLLAKSADFGGLLKVNVGGMVIHCHPNGPDTIEFDILRSDVDGPDRLNVLAGFMERLANVTQKVVTLAHDGAPEAVIGRAFPTVPRSE